MSKLHIDYEKRRQVVLCVLFSFFLGTLAILNILGITRFIDLSFNLLGFKIPLVLAVGTLPYPMTFLCTDLVSELFGREKANLLVWCGAIVNIWVLFILWLGGVLPGFEVVSSDGEIIKDVAGRLPVFFEIQKLTFGATFASMLAYFVAQFCDVHIFHLLKKKTNGRHLWLRNNGSTLLSQFIDSTSVILITHYYAKALPIDEHKPLHYQLLIFIFSSYLFKAIAALMDTIPFYLCTHHLKRYLNIKS